MKKVPAFLGGTTFPSAQNTKGGVTSTVYDMTSQVLKNIEKLELDYLVAIGGDDTLSYAAHLDRQGVKVIAVPKTMDNDVRNTEYCIGFSTAVSRASDAIDRQRTTVGSHERIGVFRIFGRDAGYTALYTAYVCSHALLHSGIQGQSRQADRSDSRRQEEQPEQLRARSAFRRRRVGGLSGDANTARPTRSAIARRPTSPKL